MQAGYCCVCSEKTALRGFDQFMAKGFEKLFSSIIVVDKVSLSD